MTSPAVGQGVRACEIRKGGKGSKRVARKARGASGERGQEGLGRARRARGGARGGQEDKRARGQEGKRGQEGPRRCKRGKRSKRSSDGQRWAAREGKQHTFIKAADGGEVLPNASYTGATFSPIISRAAHTKHAYMPRLSAHPAAGCLASQNQISTALSLGCKHITTGVCAFSVIHRLYSESR